MIDPGLAAGYLEAWKDWAGASEVLAQDVACLAELVCLVLRNGGQILLCGNGGSAADAEHFAGEMVGRFAAERRPYRVTALTTNTAVLTAICNDYGLERVFARQVEAAARPGDLLMVISTSGQSANVLSALRAGRAQGCLNAALVGPGVLPETLTAYSDLVTAVQRPPTAALTVFGPGPEGGQRAGLLTPHIQEVHEAVLHCLAYLIEGELAGAPDPAALPRRPAVFLDRDGTLVESRGYLTDPDQLVLIPGAAEAVRLLNAAGVAAVVTTNQSAVARGLIDEPRLEEIHDRLRGLLGREGAVLDGLYSCPHHPPLTVRGPGGQGWSGRCPCRKPLPGMILRAAAELNLDLPSSAAVGDTWADVRAGLAAGGRGLLVRTGRGTGELSAGAPVPPEAEGRCGVEADVLAAVRRELARMRPAAAGGRPE